MGDGIFGTDYVSFADMFDGGGPGASGDTYSNVSNVDKDKNNDGHISFSESEGNLAGGIDGFFKMFLVLMPITKTLI